MGDHDLIPHQEDCSQPGVETEDCEEEECGNVARLRRMIWSQSTARLESTPGVRVEFRVRERDSIQVGGGRYYTSESVQLGGPRVFFVIRPIFIPRSLSVQNIFCKVVRYLKDFASRKVSEVATCQNPDLVEARCKVCYFVK